jgi:Protein of unknown function (DUF4199)
MKKTILKFGLISGLLSSVMMLATAPFEDKIGSYYLGYTLIILSFLLVYFGIRSYRDNVGDGQITFTQGFAVGISITLISCLFYVLTWEILYFTVLHDFMDKYNAHIIEKARAAGASAAALQAQLQELKKFKDKYENPLFNSAMTFLEPFPVGLGITLISAAVLRKKARSQPAQSALPISN